MLAQLLHILALVPSPTLHYANSHALRCPQCECVEWPPAGVLVTIASGFAILLRPDSALWGVLPEPEPRADTMALTDALCRPSGWEFRLALDASEASSERDLSLLLAFECDARFRAYPQGTVRLLRQSRFVSTGLWSLEMDAQSEGQLPDLEVCLQITSPITDSVPPGPCFLNAELQLDERASRVEALTSGRTDSPSVLRFADTRIRVKELTGLGGLAGLSQLKSVCVNTATLTRAGALRPSL